MTDLGEVSTLNTPRELAVVPFTDVTVTAGLWAERIRTAVERTIPHVLAQCRESGRINNLHAACGHPQHHFTGRYFGDSDVYKTLEGVAYALSLRPDPNLAAAADKIIDLIAAMQREDGYLNSFLQTEGRLDKRWTDEKEMHETYCIGHLIEAAIAYHQATGKDRLLQVARRAADHVEQALCCAEHGARDVPGHSEIELALVKLWKHTGDSRYVALARTLVDGRGDVHHRPSQGEYAQDHLPVRAQREAVGHAVRAMYLYCAMANLCRIDKDRELEVALGAIWRDLTQRKMYVTGGIGCSAANEGFGAAYELPNDSAYCETCAAIGLVMLAHRLTHLHGDRKYADLAELTLYNAVLPGLSLDGEGFFYSNPLASRGSYGRQPWFEVSCCPTNLARFIPTIGGLAYGVRGRDLFVHHYLSSTATIDADGLAIQLDQQTQYPWDGHITLTLNGAGGEELTLYLRVPGWCEQWDVIVNGEVVPCAQLVRGYLRLHRKWNDGDRIELRLNMPVRRMFSDQRVIENRGRVSVLRGPIVYCVEAADHDAEIDTIVLPSAATLSEEHRPNLLGGVTIVRSTALAVKSDARLGRLYYADSATPTHPVNLYAIPYFAWANRGSGAMAVWLPVDAPITWSAGNAHAPIVAAASASTLIADDVVVALSDLREPANSNDTAQPRFIWHGRRGGVEWLQYHFSRPIEVWGSSVYWLDDARTGGSCRLPSDWLLLYYSGSQWLRVEAVDEFHLRQHSWNTVRFKPIRTRSLRLEARLREHDSAGLLKWRVMY